MSVALVQRTSWFNAEEVATILQVVMHLVICLSTITIKIFSFTKLLMTTPYYILYNHVVSCERTVFLTVFLLLQDHVPDANLSVLLQTVYPPNLLEAREMFQDALKV